MSFLVPVGPRRSDGSLVPPQTPEEKAAARDYLNRLRLVHGDDPHHDFFQWPKELFEDVIHYRPIDSLPEEQQQAIRLRRQEAFENSYIPWIVTDAAALLMGLDDIDDTIKTGQLLNRYAIQPALKLADIAGLPGAWFKTPTLRNWRTQCRRKVPNRERKLRFINEAVPERLDVPTKTGFGRLFPKWGFWSLAIQALQVTDGIFGVGLQLGPIIGRAMEVFFRTAAALGLPFSPSDNKYHQILRGRTNAQAPRLLAAQEALHPEDLFSVLHGLRIASSPDVIPPQIIHPNDYPDVFNMFTEPWQEIRNFAGLAASIPYNIVGGIVNNLIAPPLVSWSNNIEGTPLDLYPDPQLDNFPRWVMERLAKGLCPANQCDAELMQALAFLAQARRRNLPQPKFKDPEFTMADRLRLILNFVFPGLGA